MVDLDPEMGDPKPAEPVTVEPKSAELEVMVVVAKSGMTELEFAEMVVPAGVNP